jgi:hypothetical protein
MSEVVSWARIVAVVPAAAPIRSSTSPSWRFQVGQSPGPRPAEEDTAARGSDHPVDGLVAWEGLEDVATRIDDHLGAGADQVWFGSSTLILTAYHFNNGVKSRRTLIR